MHACTSVLTLHWELVWFKNVWLEAFSLLCHSTHLVCINITLDITYNSSTYYAGHVHRGWNNCRPCALFQPHERSSIIQPEEENIMLAPWLLIWSTERKLHFNSGTKNASLNKQLIWERSNVLNVSCSTSGIIFSMKSWWKRNWTFEPWIRAGFQVIIWLLQPESIKEWGLPRLKEWRPILYCKRRVLLAIFLGV